MENFPDNNHFLIVIGRQYGSGGRRIGRAIADELGINYYDKTLLRHAAESLGYSPHIFEQNDERRPSLLRSLLSFNYGAPTASINEAPMSHEKIYEFQSRMIRDIASRESCVIVGRTADYIMRNHPRMVSLFIHAPIEHRVSNIIDRKEAASTQEASELAQRMDRNRESFYNYFTNRSGWGRADNYTLSVDASKISDQAIIAMVRSILNLS